MKLGAEPKKMAIFGGLVLLAAMLHFMGDDGPSRQNGKGGGDVPSPVPAAMPATSGSAAPRTVTPAAQMTRPLNSNRRTSQEWKPVLRSRRVEDRIDPTTIDPTLRTDLLAKLGDVPIQGGGRPLFEFSAAPPPKAPDPGKIIPGKPAISAAKPPFPVPVKPVPTPGAKPVEGAKPQAPPIPLKFYGFTSARAGVKRAFFLENEDVFVANEGEAIKRRYKVVRVNMNSVVMEDLDFKQQQTLPLVEQSQ